MFMHDNMRRLSSSYHGHHLGCRHHRRCNQSSFVITPLSSPVSNSPRATASSTLNAYATGLMPPTHAMSPPLMPSSSPRRYHAIIIPRPLISRATNINYTLPLVQ